LRNGRRLGLRCPCWLGRRHHRRDRLGRRWRRSNRAGRQERHRVEIAVSGVRGPDAEVDIGGRPLRTAGLPGDTEHPSLGDRCTLAGRDLCEMGQGDGIAHCLNRHGPAGARNGSGKRDDSSGRRPHRLTFRPGNVDSTVLPGRVRIGPERVGPKHVAPERPAPAPAGWNCNESDKNDETDRETTHCSTSCGYCNSFVTNIDNYRVRVARSMVVVKYGYKEVSYSTFRGTPVSRETTVTAIFRGVPAATSSTTAARAAPASATRVDGPITSVTSPRGGSP
jgi:hypothetical protein